MAETKRYAVGNPLDIEQILSEAQHRWLRPAEICEILQNYKRFRIAPEAQNMPPSGSLFLFDRKVLRYFRKDGHNWRKKKDGKTVKEAHERLKAGSVDVLHCYYAHGEENENFQRRCYWLLEEELSHIVLVHYREVTSSRAHFNRIKETGETIPYSQEAEEAISNELDTAASSIFHHSDHHMHSQTTDATSVNGTQATEYEDAESVYNQQASSRFHSSLEPQQPAMENINAGYYDPYSTVPFSNGYQGNLSTISGMDFSLSQANKCKDGNDTGLTYDPKKHLDFWSRENVLGNGTPAVESVPFQPSCVSSQSDTIRAFPKQDREIPGQFLTNSISGRQEFDSQIQVSQEWKAFKRDSSDLPTGTTDQKLHSDFVHDLTSEFQEQETKYIDLVNPLNPYSPHPHVQNDLAGINDLPMPLLNTELKPGSESSLAVDRKSIYSFQLEAENCKWSCMFGEVEVPAEVIADGVLRCCTPMHEAGTIPFYVTCSNRLACSEVREFEYRTGHIQSKDKEENFSGSAIEHLQMRFGKLLHLSSVCQNSNATSVHDVSHLSSKISPLLLENPDEWDQMLMLASGPQFSLEKVKDQLLQKLLKENLHSWLLQKAAEGGKGPNVLDEGGQGIIHFAAALGYDWALEPIKLSGVNVNFRDVNGWTALHWAAFCGRERTVASLIALGAAPGALTDPTLKYPSGSTAADLASANGHKGIAGYLAESDLSAHLSSLHLENQADAADISDRKAVETISEKSALPMNYRDLPQGSSLKDSLAAVCNATQAAARIHQVFRVQSFQKKQLKELNHVNSGMSDEHALSLISVKTSKPGHDEPAHAAAIRIQNKFRGWKGRKDFLIIRQRIVKIQAHVRGHQVRKNYKKIIWSVGILEKIILRWRRKGSGLRGFRSEAVTESMQDTSSKEEDDDFFKKGRKQTEERLNKALARVKSMVQYPEARDQYRRLLNVVTEIQESKVANVLHISEEAIYFDDDLIDIEALLDDDTYMPTAS
ncbi:calmodulin-binding transcription activator 3-like [Carica papaya]|uniref:calmodulin-binding transcription activator 3-like n=1 Tax=Carica papaya TaxID=3649 RepID=UPI000B8CCE42|nr:calmodulin-binding transcription activator 3-like [Carica papaya]